VSNPVATVRHAKHGQTGEWLYDSVGVWCPGCSEGRTSGSGYHALIVKAPEGSSAPVWGWDGNIERPTFTPSLLCEGEIRCHSFIVAGQWQFLGDCEHPLAGQTVDMVPLPDWCVRA
jgi:hypothetical protein